MHEERQRQVDGGRERGELSQRICRAVVSRLAALLPEVPVRRVEVLLQVSQQSV